MSKTGFWIIALLPIFAGAAVAQTAGDFRSAGTGAWNAAATWERFDGSSWVPASAPPTSADNAITIRSGDTVTVAVAVTTDQTIIAAGGRLSVAPGITLTLNNGAGTDLTVAGMLANAGSTAGTGTITVSAGGVYRHEHTTTAGTIPTAVWNAGSLCEIAGYTTNTTAPSGLGQSFSDFTWNAPAQTGVISAAGALTTVNGNFTVAATGTGTFRLGQTVSPTVAIGGNFVQSGGNFSLTGGTGNPTVNLTGDLILTGGVLLMSEGSGVGTLNAGGNAYLAGGTLTETSTGSGAFRFTRAGTQTFTGGAAIQNTINFTVTSGSTLLLGTGALTGGGTFTLSSGGTLGIGSPAGITTSGASGNVQVTGTRTYSTGAGYLYNGTSAQAAGNGLPATVRNLTLDNPGGLTLSSALTATGDILLLQGTLTLGNLNLSVGGNWTNNGGTLSAGTGTVTFTGASKTIGGSAPTSFPGLTIASGSSVTLATDATAASLSFSGGGTAGTLTHSPGGTLAVGGNVTMSQPTAAVTNLWNIQAGGATVGGNVTIGGTNTTTSRVARVALTTGTLTIGGNLVFNSSSSTAGTAVLDMSGGAGRLTLSGSLTLNANTGTLLPGTAGSIVDYAGSTAGQTVVLGSAIAYNDLHLNNTSAGGATLGAAVTAAKVSGDLRVQSGLLSNGGFAVTGNAGKTFEVADGATFRLTGTSGMAAGFGTRTFGPLSTVDYAGPGAQPVKGEQYGNLSITGARGSAQVTLDPAGTIRIAGAFSPIATFTTGGYVVAGSTVEFDGTGSQSIPAFAFQNLTISGDRGTGTVTIPSGATVGIGGTFTPSATFSGGSYIATGSTVEFTGGAQTIPVFPYHALSTGGSGTKTPGGGLTVGGNLAIGPGTTFAAGSFTHVLRGSVSLFGSLDPGTGTVELAGQSVQTLSGTSFSFSSLRVNSAGVTIAGVDVTVTGVLTLQAGTIATGGGAVIVTGSVSRTAGHVAGNLRKTVTAAAPAPLFEIGDGVQYTPIALTFSGVAASGTVTARSDPGDHPAIAVSGIRANRSVNRRYTLTGAGLAFGSYAATFTFVPTDVDAGANTGAFVVRRYSDPSWFQSPTGTRTATSTQTTGVTGFGAFQIGEGGAAFPGTSLVDAAPGTVVANGAAAAAVTVTLRDDQGNGLTAGGDAVTIISGLGSVGPVTDNGNGTYTALLTSTVSGTATVRATVNTGMIADSAVVQFLPGPVSLLLSTISANPAAIIANGGTTSRITVQLKDAFGNNLTGSAGTVALATTHGTLGAVTDSANGRYGAVLTSAPVVDTARVTGTLNGSPFADDARVAFVEGVPTSVAWIRSPRDTVAGATLSSAGGSPAVEIRDASGFRVQNATNAVTVALAANPGGATLGGTVARNAVNGIVVFDDLVLTKAAAGYTLAASSAGLTGDTSASFRIRAAAPAALAFAQQPTNSVINQIITPAVVVRTTDAFGNPTATAGVSITMTLSSGTGTLGGSVTVPTDTSGAASFSTLTIDALGTKRLTASVAGLTSVQSVAFAITQPPSSLVSDDFNAFDLAPFWTFIDPLADASLTMTGTNTPNASVTLAVPAGSEHDASTRGLQVPRIMQAANNTDFQVEAKFLSGVSQRFQMQGFIVEQDSLNFLRFDFNSDGVSTRVFVCTVTGGVQTSLINFSVASNATTPLWMRVQRAGDSWTQLYSLNGVSWNPTGTFSHPIVVERVGLFTGNAGTAPPAPFHAGVFDYFFNTSSPINPEDGGTAVDTIPPVITRLAVAPDDTSATVTWTTTERSRSSVAYGLTPAYELGTLSDTAAVNHHTIRLTGLQTQRVYHFRAASTDLRNNTGYGPDTTFATPDSSIIRSDDFNTFVLKAPWSFVNPRNDAALQFTGQNTSDARARITVPAGTVHQPWVGGNTAPRIMQPANDRDFTIEAKFESPLTQLYQMQGLLVEEDSLTYLRFDVNSDGAGTRVFGGTVVNGSGTAYVNAQVAPAGVTPQYLRLSREGPLWALRYSFDGSLWTVAATLSQAMVVRRVGVYAGNAGSSPPSHTALVDYFFNTRSPIVPEDGGFAPDVVPPVISAIQSTTTASTATITWTTDEPATSAVSYGLTSAYEAGTVVDPAFVTAHAVVLTGLTPATAYRFRVASTDTVANTAAGPDSGFTTLSSSTVVSDDFNSPALNTAVWTFINPLSDATLAVANTNTDSAWLVIGVPGGTAHDIWTTGRNAPRIMQAANDVDFEVEARFDSRMTQRYQIQGILVEQNAAEFIRFDFNSDGSNTKAFAATFTGGAPTTRVNATIGANGAVPQWMRVRRQGSQWSLRYSFNGTTWSTAGTFTFGLAVAAVGPFIGNSGTTPPAHTGKIDYFFNTSSPIIPEDAVRDTLPPVISAVQATPGPGFFRVQWATDERARGRVDYGLTAAYELGSVTDSPLVLNRTITVAGLETQRTYHYRVVSTDSSGNIAFGGDSLITTLPPAVAVAIRLFLQGPYDAAGDTLRTDLRNQGLLPRAQPYGSPPWNYAGGERIDSTLPGIVDWILLELRSSGDSTLVAGRRAAILTHTGNVIDTSGAPSVPFENLPAGNYFLVVRHRNHLGVMSAAPVPLSSSPPAYDFSGAQEQAFGFLPMRELDPGVFGLRSGDGTADGGVDALDRNLVWRPQNGTPWEYGKAGDFNLDGGIDAIDLNLHWRPNNGTASQIPEPPAHRTRSEEQR